MYWVYDIPTASLALLFAMVFVYNIRRPIKSLLKSHVSGEGYCRTYDGPGRLLISSVPYWRFRLLGQQPGEMRNAAAL